MFLSWHENARIAYHNDNDPGYIEIEECNTEVKPCRMFKFVISFLFIFFL